MKFQRTLLVGLTLLLASCAGTRAREALRPALRAMWTNGIRPAVVRNIYPLPTEERLLWEARIRLADTALRIGIKGDIADTDWVSFTDRAEDQIQKDIENGELVEATAEPLREEIQVFHETMAVFLEAR